MYNAQETKDRIKALCKLKQVNMETLLSSCDLGINAIRQINDKKGMASYSLARIADYLDCSVDYLLGRTSVPKIIRPKNTVPEGEDGSLEELLSIYNSLNQEGMDELLHYARYAESRDEYKKSNQSQLGKKEA